MEKVTGNKTVIIGAGNVATHLAHAYRDILNISQVFSRSMKNAKILADSIKCNDYTDKPESITADADIYIFAVKDDAIGPLLDRINIPEKALAIHTSGSVSKNIFENRANRFGILYPLQTFTKNIPVDFSKIAFFIEGDSAETCREIELLAKTLSGKVYEADSDQRKRLHIAAVFACNFANNMWSIANEITDKNDLPFDVLLPLIQATVDKLKYTSPLNAQTGPAVRQDHVIINNHIDMLDGGKKNIYRIISDNIIKMSEDECNKL